jgi:putative ABC transport system permease protein
MGLVMRVPFASAGMVEEVKHTIWREDSQIPVNDIQTMDQMLSVSLAQQRFTVLLLGIFAVLALALTTVGVYGIVSYTVRQRRHEIGIRMALGAERSQVVRLIVGQGARLALLGVGIGIAGGLASTRLMVGLLFGVSASDPLTFFAAALLLGVAALAASYLPAFRASRRDPTIVLRQD